MKITVIRHGKVDMKWKKWYTAEQFNMDCSNYDLAPLCPFDNETKDNTQDDIYVSTLKRSRETAEKLFERKDFIENKLLNEVPLKSFCDCKFCLPLWIWNIVGRLQWLLNSKRQIEGKNETENRADTLIEELMQRNKDGVLITHGFFMRTMMKELKRYGFAIDKNTMTFANLERVIATK